MNIFERINKDKKTEKKIVKPFVLWFTGLPSSGKTTIAGEVYKFLKEKKYKVERFDGDAIRAIFPSTGVDREERNNHIKRIGYLASLLERNGVIVVCSFISPYEESRKFVRELCNNFVEVYVSTPLEICEERDNKGLYKKARSGELHSFTGVNDPYEIPENPNINIDTRNMSIEESFSRVKDFTSKYF